VPHPGRNLSHGVALGKACLPYATDLRCSDESLFLVWRVRKADAPVLTPAFVVGFRADRVQFSPTHRHCDSILRNAFADHGLFDPIRSPLREREIVDQVPSGRRVAVNIKATIGMVLQPADIVIQNARVRRVIMVIPGEQDFMDVLVKRFLVGTKQSHSWLIPVSDPEGNISG
jgi:hypothetical protein